MTSESRLRLELWLVLALLVGGNFFVRNVLERWNHASYFTLAGTDLDELKSQPWKALLPIYIGGGQTWWAATSQLVVELMIRATSPRAAFYLLNAIAIVATFWISWHALRSRIFTYTATICIAFGTQLHYSYALSGTFCMYLQIVYLEWILLCLYRLLSEDRPPRIWKIGYVVGLIVYALGFDHWYNYLLFIVLCAPLLWVYHRRVGLGLRNRQVGFVTAVALVVACLHLSIKLNYSGQHFTPGREDELIAVYRYPLLAVEDFVSNVFTYNFITLTNYAPPFVLGSNSDFRLGTDVILAEQHGYHPSHTQLVAMHHRFLWYFYAGLTFAGYAYLLVSSVVRALRNGSAKWLAASLMLIGIFAGAGTHMLIKYRPYMSVPSLTYKCLPAVLASTVLLAYALMLWRSMPSRRRLSSVGIGLVWLTVLYGGLARPRVLSHLNQQVGLASYPDPLAHLFKWTRGKDQARR